MILAAKGLGVLNLVKEIVMKISQMNLSKIIVHINNKQILNSINCEIWKES